MRIRLFLSIPLFKIVIAKMLLYYVYTHMYILVYTILCKVENIFKIRSDEHKTTGYLDIMAGVRCYINSSQAIYVFIL